MFVSLLTHICLTPPQWVNTRNHGHGLDQVYMENLISFTVFLKMPQYPTRCCCPFLIMSFDQQKMHFISLTHSTTTTPPPTAPCPHHLPPPSPSPHPHVLLVLTFGNDKCNCRANLLSLFWKVSSAGLTVSHYQTAQGKKNYQSDRFFFFISYKQIKEFQNSLSRASEDFDKRRAMLCLIKVWNRWF